MKSSNPKLIYFCLSLHFFLTLAYSQEPDSSKAAVDSTTTNFEPRKNKIRAVWESNDERVRGLIAEDIADFSKVLPNIYSLDTGSLGQLSPLSYRGSTPQQSEILLGDLTLENPISGFVSTTAVPINLAAKFRVLGMDSFSPFGAQFVGGLFQTDLYEFNGSRPYSRVNFRAGDWGYSDLGILFGLPITKSINFTFAGSRQQFSGFEANRDHTGSRILGQITYRPSVKLQVGYIALLNKNDFQIPSPLLPAFVPWEPGFERRDKRFDQGLSLKLGNLDEENKLLRANVFFSTIREQSITDSLAFNPQTKSFGLRIQQEIVTNKQRLVVGGGVKIHDLNSARLGDHTDRNGHLFVQDELHIAKQWRFGLQLNVETQTGFPPAFHPAVFLRYEPSANHLVWLGLKRARRYPSFSERFWPTSIFRADPELKAEKGSSVEVGVSMDHDKMTLQSALFIHQVDNWIGNIPLASAEEFGSVNLGKRTILGHDLKFIWKFLPGGELGFISSYLTVKEPEFSKQLQVPEVSIYSYVELGNFFFEDFVYINLRFVGRVFGERFGLFFGEEGTAPVVGKLSETSVFDGQISFQFSDARVSISMENILDNNYQLVPGFIMPPKTLRFGIAWEFWD